MATYNKRGFKAPKPKEEKDDQTEDILVDEKNSTTAGVFSTLDETANRTEDWIARNQKIILGVIGAVAFVAVSYLLYQKFILGPKEADAAEQMFTAQQNFQQAIDGDVKADSLFALSLKGSEGKLGFVDIADQYSGTDAGNLANYYAGIAYLNTGKYAEAVESLDKFKSDDVFLSVLAHGAMGDAYAQQNKLQEAFDHYVKAAEKNVNEFTTPRYLMKAGQVALLLGKKDDALKHFTEIKEKYDMSPEAANVDAMLGLAQK